MKQEGISTPTGGGEGFRRRLFRLPRLALAVVVLAVAVAVVAVVAGSAQAQTTTTLQLAYHTNGDTIAVPGKLHPTETLAGPDGTEYPVAHDDSKAYFRVTASGGGNLFSRNSDGVVAGFEYSYANGFGNPTSGERSLIGKFGPPWSLSTIIMMANAGPPTFAKTTGPLTITLVEKDGEPYTVGTNHSLCIVLHDLSGNVTGDNCQSGS